MAYGLARDKRRPRSSSATPRTPTRRMPGSGGALRLTPGKPPEEVAFGLRNPLGWCAGPDGEVFFTDNQGDWVAANKLCHVDDGQVLRLAEPRRSRSTRRSPPARRRSGCRTRWARSINGVAYDNTGGKFGPFAGQFFMAELMFGGAIIRANVEKVNGVYQGACFPFWGKGLLGPVTLAFDPRGKLYVGGITEPGWMAQPDRGALFRIDFTGRGAVRDAVDPRPAAAASASCSRRRSTGRRPATSASYQLEQLPLRVHRRVRLARARPHGGEGREGRGCRPTG